MRSLKILFLAAIGQLVFSQAVYKIVNLEQGPVKGYLEPDGDMFVFYNIPYATVPKTNLFQAPLPAPTWKYTFEAVKSNKEILCPQFIQNFEKLLDIKEDCLIANIYTPDRNETGLLPVLVIVHGGGFNTGFGEFLTPKSLVKSRRIVAVTFNYRLGAFGFLCLGTEEVPGNAGLKDQVALLRWVRNNIKKFGGNPNHVTISGYSAGSTSVLLLTLSKSAEGLFQKVIPESGSDLAAYTFQAYPLEIAKHFAKLLEHSVDVNNIDELENFYKQASVEALTNPEFVNEINTTIPFSPCVEKNLGQEVFISDAPINILKSGNFTKVPILYGFTDLEGFSMSKLNLQDCRPEKPRDTVPGYIYFESEEQREDVADKIKHFYFGDKPIGPETFLQYVDYNSDVYFTIPSLLSIKLRLEADAGPIYLYEYSYADNESTSLVPSTTGVPGADHIAQTFAVLNTHKSIKIFNDSNNNAFNKMRNIMREMWLNFIITGKPTVKATEEYPEWPAVASYNSPYMSLNATMRLRTSLLEKRFKFWSEIYDKHYRTPQPPSSATSIPFMISNIYCLCLVIRLI